MVNIIDTYEVSDASISANKNGKVSFTLSKNETWYVERIELKGVPLDASVSISYKDKESQRVSLQSLSASDFPLNFKKTATDRPFTLYPEASMQINISNPLNVAIHAYAKVFFNRARETAKEV